MSGQGDENGAPLFGALSLMTLNINGFSTKIKKGNKMVKKYRELGRHLLAKDVDLAAVQEPHLGSQASKAQEHREVSDFFPTRGMACSQTFLEGRGGGGQHSCGTSEGGNFSEHGPWDPEYLCAACLVLRGRRYVSSPLIFLTDQGNGGRSGGNSSASWSPSPASIKF